jgi:hypothetical protein
MDIACLGAVLVGRTWDVTSTVTVVSVDVVDVDGLWGCALRERMRNRHDGATLLSGDKKTPQDGRYTSRKAQ